MTGSDGKGYSGGFEPIGDCGSLLVETQLSSPKEEAVEAVKPGQILDVELQQIGAMTVVVVMHQGQLVGGIAAPQVQKLRECISQGFKYEATVINKNDGQVRVRVKPKQS